LFELNSARKVRKRNNILFEIYYLKYMICVFEIYNFFIIYIIILYISNHAFKILDLYNKLFN